MLCRLFTERADGFCHCVVPSKQQPQGTLQGAEPAAASGYAIFSTHWPHFNVRWRQKRWREGCWLAAFSDKDEGFVLWQSAPLRPWRHCSASSQPHNVTAKSVKPQQRQLLFFDTVEVKLVKKKKKKVRPGKQISHFQIPLCGLHCCISLIFSHRKVTMARVPSFLHRPNFFWWWLHGMDNFWDVR